MTLEQAPMVHIDHHIGRGRTIVVAEPDEATRSSLRFALQAEGYAVSTYSDAASLLAAPVAGRADAYILDHHLPDMTGVELLSRLRAAHATGPALFLAGRATAALRRAAAEMNAAILDKPLIGDALSAGLSALFTRSPNGATPPT